MSEQAPLESCEPTTSTPAPAGKRVYTRPVIEPLGSLLHATAGTAGAPGDATGNPASVTGG